MKLEAKIDAAKMKLNAKQDVASKKRTMTEANIKFPVAENDVKRAKFT